MSTDQKGIPTSIDMDARNFLRAINNSAQSKVAFFENVVRRLGQEAKRDFRLVALHPASLIFEDSKTHEYFTGSIKKDGPRYRVDEIKKINVVEEKKADLFDKNCTELVDSIAEQDFKNADKTFNKIELQRFRSSVVPESGWVTTRDGETRFIPVKDDKAVTDNRIPNIIKAFAEAVSDSVEVADGNVVSGTFVETGDKFTIPVDEITRRRIVARKMKNVAEGAHQSPTFQKLVLNVAGLVSEQKVAEAVELAAKFLKEEQEFCLLGKSGMKNLVESTLATQMEFNPFLVEDVATLMYKTNLKVNHDTIIECWTKTAEKAQSAELLTGIKNLAESKDFVSDYNLFLENVLSEAGGIDTNRAKAYTVAMKVIKNVLGHIEGQEELVKDIDQMIAALDAAEPATDVIYQAEELLAGISDTIIDKVQTLDSFDRMPGVEAGEPEAEAGAEDEAGTPVPLPELGGEEAEEVATPGAEVAAPEVGAGAEAGAEVPVGAAAESKVKSGKTISESDYTPIEKMSVLELQEELLSWQTDGHLFLKEDGFEDCFSQLNRYIDRCRNIGSTAKPVMEAFEKIRDVVVDSGNDVSLDLPDDPYEGVVDIKETTKVNQDYGVVTEDMGKSDGKGGDEAPSNPDPNLKQPKGMFGRNYSRGETEMSDELQDKTKGLAEKGSKNVSGQDGDKAPSNADPSLKQPKGAFGRNYSRGETSMSDELQSKTKGLAGHGKKDVSGQDAEGANNPNDPSLKQPKGVLGRSHAQGEVSMSDELQSKTKAIGESFVDRLDKVLGETHEPYAKQTGVKHAEGGGTLKAPKGTLGRNYSEGETEMGDELQAEKGQYFNKKREGDIKEEYAKQTGVTKSGLDGGYLKQPKGVLGRKYDEGEAEMSDELQDEKKEYFDKSKKADEPVKESVEDNVITVDDLKKATDVVDSVELPEGAIVDAPKGEVAATEDQYKGPRVHGRGFDKASFEPKEKGVKESKDSIDALAEDVAVVYSTDERVDDVIARVVEAMKETEEVSALPLPPTVMEPPMEPVVPPVEPELPEAQEETEEPVGESKIVKENKDECPKCGVECKCPCPDCGKVECKCE